MKAQEVLKSLEKKVQDLLNASVAKFRTLKQKKNEAIVRILSGMLTKRVVAIEFKKAKIKAGRKLTAISITSADREGRYTATIFVHQGGGVEMFDYNNHEDAMNDFELASSYLGKVP